MTTIDDVTARVAAAHRRLDSLERLLDDLEGVKHVKQHLQRERLTSSALKTAPSDYYSWTLSQRAKFLGCGISHLCKSIVVENVACVNKGIEDPLNSRYYCVVLQYISKLDAEQLRRFVRDDIPEADRPSRKKFNFQHAPAQVSEQLTGFKHNGVSTFGMQTSIPVIVAGEVAALKPAFLWLGGGAETVKLRVSVQDLITTLGARVADGITTQRTDLDKA
uniref:YbaK/aminoacyl-tRNA synthetase-associated domain-containing protein n=1 Tax=Peronospora matthiolae TaxID=2874970 RepID=A0AAV1UAG1_9STRA